MVYIKWKCDSCNDIVISNSFRHHELNSCKCGKSFMDLEEGYSRIGGEVESLKTYDYNFFDEIVLCLELQEFKPLFEFNNKRYIDLEVVHKIRKLEDEIIKGLKDD